jgi:hypothetical protein
MTSRLEQIARIIDRDAFIHADSYKVGSDLQQQWVQRKNHALEKARAILALPPSPDARNAALEDAIIWHKEKQIHFEERENYFRHGNGYRTHCRGSIGAEDAADDFKRLASHHRESAKALLALQSPRVETPGTVGKEAVARWLKDPAVKEALHRAPTPSADAVERAKEHADYLDNFSFSFREGSGHQTSLRQMAEDFRTLAISGLLTGGKEGWQRLVELIPASTLSLHPEADSYVVQLDFADPKSALAAMKVLESFAPLPADKEEA